MTQQISPNTPEKHQSMDDLEMLENPYSPTKMSRKDIFICIAAVCGLLMNLVGGCLISAVSTFSAPIILLAIGIPLVIVGSLTLYLCIRNGLLPIIMDRVINRLSGITLPSFERLLDRDVDRIKDPILDQNKQVEYIKKNTMGILSRAPSSFIKIHAKSLGLSMRFSFTQDSKRVYKIDKNVRDIRNANGSSHVYNLLKSYKKIKSICTSEHLDKLIAPAAEHITIPSESYNDPNFVHDVLIEPKINFYEYDSIESNDRKQNEIHLKHPKNITPAIEQLAHLVCKTGCYINQDNFLFKPNSTSKLYLYEIMIPESAHEQVTKQHIEDGLFGTTTTEGLVNCLQSKPLIEKVLNIASSYGLDINSPRIKALVQGRFHQLDNQQLIRDLYKNPPKLPNEVDFTSRTFEDLGRGISSISSEATDFINQELPNHIKQSSYNASQISKIKTHPEWTFSLYPTDTLAINTFKKYLFLQKTIKEKNLNTIIIPEHELLEITLDNKIYYVIASKKLDISKDYSDTAYHNSKIASSGSNYLQALKDLVHLNIVLGLDISLKNTILMDQQDTSGNYQIALTSLNKAHRTVAVLGRNSLLKLPFAGSAHSGVLQLAAHSQQMLDTIILEAAQLGLLHPEIARQRHDAFHTDMDISREILEFYQQKNLSSQDPLNINVEDLAPYLNLDARFEFNRNSRSTSPTISMREAANEIIGEINKELQKKLTSTNDRDPLEYRRHFVLNINELKKFPILWHYGNTFMQEVSINTKHNYLSILDQVLLALRASGSVYLRAPSYEARASCVQLNV